MLQMKKSYIAPIFSLLSRPKLKILRDTPIDLEITKRNANIQSDRVFKAVAEPRTKGVVACCEDCTGKNDAHKHA